MRIEVKNIILKNGQNITLRSPEKSDAQAVLDNMKITCGETHFMVWYPEELERPLEMEENFLDSVCQDKKSFMIAAFDGDKLIGCASLMKMGEPLKYQHRGGLGISIQQKYCNDGLGTLMMKELLTYAKQNFEQVELGVYDDNIRAIHLYEKLGFQRCGVLPRVFKLKDGSYHDEILMIYSCATNTN